MKIPTPQYRCPSGAAARDHRSWTRSSNVAGATSTSWWSTRRRRRLDFIEREFVRHRRTPLRREGASWLTVDDRGRGRTLRGGGQHRTTPATRACAGLLQLLACHRAQGVGSLRGRREGLPTLPARARGHRPDAGDDAWVQWLEVEQRHLVWMRAKRYGWRDITIRFACDRTTAWRRWQRHCRRSPTNSMACVHRVGFGVIWRAWSACACISGVSGFCPATKRRSGRSISSIFWTAVTAEASGPGKRGPSWPKSNAGGASATLF
jgi:hypothetical protein